ncbi:Ribosomal RNA-processing protein 12 [Ophiocordyceps camponoti-floridani]|uniref:Ribosomal RNA-processing protein 12 n=1 Tax=Ophiocordyceps camponoti-floridani TaxID=2030778 RepID=A0A8H4VHE5_9HYPO|nr:Ribosomal RNA-processing protein 12 [Ophiocordyceps camponoti-floridani]
MAIPTLEEKLEKIKSPSLQSQQRTAVILQAVESTLREQNTAPTPTGYFAALLALLQQANSGEGIDAALAAPAVYLLDVVTPYAPQPLLRSKFTQILTLLAPVLLLQDAEPILLRSSIGCLESLLLAQDGPSWDLSVSQIGPRRAVAGLLSLSLHHRPKVRRRAQDALKTVLRNPPPSPALDHPAADMCAQTALKKLEDLAAKVTGARRGKKSTSAAHEPALIHALQLVKSVAVASGGWPSTRIESLCELLLNIAKTGNDYMTMAGFDIFELIFKGMSEEATSARLPRLMDIISELRPGANDTQLVPPWLAVVSRGYDISSQLEPQDTFQKLPDLFTLVAQFLQSQSENIRISASECIVSFIANCIPDQAVLDPSIFDEKVLDKLAKIAQSLLTVQYQAAWPQTFDVLGAMFTALRWRAYPRMLTITKTIGEVRETPSFRNKKEADQVIGLAIRAMGPEAVLSVLPLNIARSVKGQPGRAWMFPVLRDYTSNTELAHFKREMVPLSQLLFQKVLDHGEADKTMEVKIYETLVQQTWSILPGYCHLPLDVVDAFDQPFAEMLSNLLYKQVDMRLDICKALKTLIESNQAMANSADDDEQDMLLHARVSRQQARENLDHMSQFSANMLAVLFNVYTQTLPQSRGPILQTIDAFLSTAPQQDVTATFDRVSKMLASELESSGPSSDDDNKPKQKKDHAMPSTAQTLMDLVITMSTYLPRESLATLMEIASVIAFQDTDPQLQKKAYKLIPRLANSELGKSALEERSSELQQLFLSSADKVSAPARRERLAALLSLLPFIPDSSLHFLPSILSEVVISCKETNERARQLAYDLLVQMGHRMSSSAGTPINNSLIPHMAPNATPGRASIEEYLTMVSAGLAGSTPHMISASITSLSRLLFEFAPQLSTQTLSDLIQTMDLFLTSNNREMVKSCLGFVKVCLVSLPPALILPRLPTLVPNLLVWSHEHKGHFKAKVKHILERMVRRFGFDVVQSHCPDSDQKLMANIRKTKERAKRKKKDAANKAHDGHDDDEDDDDDDDDEDDDDASHRGEQGRHGKAKRTKTQFENEFDQALYSTDTDSAQPSDTEPNLPRSRKQSRKGAKTYIVEQEDEPLDLLDGKALANMSRTKPSRPRNPTRSRANMDADGKIIVVAQDDMDVDRQGGESSGVGAYVAALKGREAATRGRGGKLKFCNRQQQQQQQQSRARAAERGDDDDMPDAVDARRPSASARGRARSGKGVIVTGRRGLGQARNRAPAAGGRIAKGRNRGHGGRR